MSTPNVDDRRLDLMTTSEIAAIDKSRAVVVWPVGAVEQHGPHLPCGTDAILAEAITAGAVRRCVPDTDIWVLPPLVFGRSVEHLGFAGTVTLSTTTLLAVCSDVAASIAASGFQRLVFVNGHGGQPQLLEVVARDIRRDTGLLVFPVFPYRFGVPDGAVSSVDELEHGIHGGELETSMMLAVAPDTVRLDQAAPGGDRVRELYAGYEVLTLEGSVPTAWVSTDLTETGVIGDPTGASAESGRVILDHLVERLAAAFVEIARFSFS